MLAKSSTVKYAHKDLYSAFSYDRFLQNFGWHNYRLFNGFFVLASKTDWYVQKELEEFDARSIQLKN